MNTPADPDFLKRWQHVLAPYGFGYRLRLLSQMMYRRFQSELDPHDLTPFHWVVLCCLWAEDGLPTSVLGERLNQVGGTITGVIDRMEERALVRRKRDSQDRRVYRIWLTPKGSDLREVLPPLVEKSMHTGSLTGISKREYELFSQIMDQMITNLGNEMGLDCALETVDSPIKI